jgi:hypothetical protein
MLSTPIISVKIMGRGNGLLKGTKPLDLCLAQKPVVVDHPLETEEVLSPLGGRPRKDSRDDLILRLAAEGKGSKMIAGALKRDGLALSSRTVSRRLAKIRGT